MVVRDGTDGVELVEIVTVGNIVSGECDDVVGRVRLRVGEESTHELVDHCPVVGGVFVKRGGCFEVFWVGETVGTNGTEVGKLEATFECLADVAEGWVASRDRVGCVEVDGKLDASLNDGDMKRWHVEKAELSLDEQRYSLRYNEEIAIRVVEAAMTHALCSDISVDGDTVLQLCVTCTGESH